MLHVYCYSSTVIIGHFNCQLTSNNHIINRRSRDTYASTLASSHNLKVVAPTSSGTVHTFYPYTGGDRTVIDHVLVDETTFYDVQNFTIKEDEPLNVSRHLPLLLTLRVNTNKSADNTTSHTRAFTRINYRWNTPRELRRFKALYQRAFHMLNFATPMILTLDITILSSACHQPLKRHCRNDDTTNSLSLTGIQR